MRAPDGFIFCPGLVERFPGDAVQDLSELLVGREVDPNRPSATLRTVNGYVRGQRTAQALLEVGVLCSQSWRRLDGPGLIELFRPLANRGLGLAYRPASFQHGLEHGDLI